MGKMDQFVCVISFKKHMVALKKELRERDQVYGLFDR
jgi:hypothetical protein